MVDLEKIIFQSLADAKVKSKSGAARGSVMHMNTKCSLKKKICESHIEEFDTIDRKELEERPAIVCMLIYRGTRKPMSRWHMTNYPSKSMTSWQHHGLQWTISIKSVSISLLAL